MMRQDSIVLRGMITAIACAFTFVPAAQAASAGIMKMLLVALQFLLIYPHLGKGRSSLILRESNI